MIIGEESRGEARWLRADVCAASLPPDPSAPLVRRVTMQISCSDVILPIYDHANCFTYHPIQSYLQPICDNWPINRYKFGDDVNCN